MAKRIRTPEYYAHQRAYMRSRRAAQSEAERLREYKDRESWRAKNLEKVRAQQRARYRARPEQMKEKQLRRDFGIGLSEYNSMLAVQGGLCAICRTDKPGGTSKGYFYVDHDHATGKVRALLCQSCNSGLGAFKDRHDLLVLAAMYLALHEARQVTAA